MGFNEFISKLFGNKAQRDMKEMMPILEKIKAVYPQIEQLDNDGLRTRAQAVKNRITESVRAERNHIAELRGGIEALDIEEREKVYTEIDKLEKQIDDKLEKALDEALPEVFAIVKDTARRFKDNEMLTVMATDFDRKIATSSILFPSMATKPFSKRMDGRRKYGKMGYGALRCATHRRYSTDKGKNEMVPVKATLVATLPVFLTPSLPMAYTVTVNDHLAARPEWMGPIYINHGLSVIASIIYAHPTNADKPTMPTSLSERTTSSVSTICAITWQPARSIWYSAGTTTPLSMRLTRC